jgi:hypothetical protein
MYAFKDNSFVPIHASNVIKTGQIEDKRINAIEKLVTDHYQVAIESLTDWREDNDAKVMVCFMLHEHLHYSIGSLAKRYRVYHLRLRNLINESYVKCLTQPAFYSQYISLKDTAFADLINSHEPAVSVKEAVGFFN